MCSTFHYIPNSSYISHIDENVPAKGLKANQISFINLYYESLLYTLFSAHFRLQTIRELVQCLHKSFLSYT